MAAYILDFKTKDYVALNSAEPLPLTYSCDRVYVEYYFKIDSNGNINISKIGKTRDGRHYREGVGIEQVLSINDNIPIPDYFIDIINFLLKPILSCDIERFQNALNFPTCGYTPTISGFERLNEIKNSQLTERYWEIVVDTIKRIKENIKKNVENPQDNLDIKTQLDTYISKTNQQQENLLELEKKIENIQTAYFDALNDNKKLKQIIETKVIKQFELESLEINGLKKEINARKQLDEYNKQQKQEMEEKEKERVWNVHKQDKQNYDPLDRYFSKKT